MFNWPLLCNHCQQTILNQPWLSKLYHGCFQLWVWCFFWVWCRYFFIFKCSVPSLPSCPFLSPCHPPFFPSSFSLFLSSFFHPWVPSLSSPISPSDYQVLIIHEQSRVVIARHHLGMANAIKLGFTSPTYHSYDYFLTISDHVSHEANTQHSEFCWCWQQPVASHSTFSSKGRESTYCWLKNSGNASKNGVTHL